MQQDRIRNFCVISHIDHGKSTLADRLLEITGAIPPSQIKEQTLDTMELERERGITIKLNPACMQWQGYELNLIDTPGHVDFSYEVSRSLQAVEGAILLVDATQGIQAQTLANLHLAKQANLTIIPVVNKIDLPSANVGAAETELRTLIGGVPILNTSAKTGAGVKEILDALVARVPAPAGQGMAPLRALIFDSFFDSFRGVVAYVRVVDGGLRAHDKLQFLGTEALGEAQEVGYLQVARKPTDTLATGEIGYVITGLKDVRLCRVGDTITIKSEIRSTKSETQHIVQPLPGYKEPRPMVFAGVYATDGEAQKLRSALEKLQLNDAALQFTPHHSPALGYGFTCGFLGLLHLEITKERLEREYGVELLVTTPSVEYRQKDTSNKILDTRDKQGLHLISNISISNIPLSEPWVALELVIPQSAIGLASELLQKARAIQKDLEFLGERVIVKAEAPLNEIITNFYDQLKSVTQGYGSMSYEFLDYRPGDLITLDVAVAGEEIEAFRQIIPRVKAERKAREIAARLKDLIPRQLFEVRIQVKAGSPSTSSTGSPQARSGQGKILASESISPLRKDVTAKLYGGDVTRKRKLLEKQKKGKSRLRRFGKVDIPSDVFVKLLKQS